MRTPRGMTLVEVLLALSVAVAALLLLSANFASSNRLARATRDRTVALVLAGNMVEDLEAHPFGTPAPASWPTDAPPAAGWEQGGLPSVVRIPIRVERRPQEMVFYRQLSFKNGSAVGRAAGAWDAATLTIWWSERGELRRVQSTLLLGRKP